MQRPTASGQPDLIREIYEEANSALIAGDATAAGQLCQRAFPRYRKDPNINCLLGEISLRLRQPQEARTWYGYALEFHENFPRALEGMGLSLLAVGKANDAVDFLRKAAAAVPNRAMTQAALGRALSEAGKRDEFDYYWGRSRVTVNRPREFGVRWIQRFGD